MDDSHYTRHLSDVNRSNGVFATTDICNEQGQIVTKQGSRIDENVTERILKFKLLKPLEESIEISNELTEENLYETIQAYFELDTSRQKIWKLHNNEEILRACCASFCDKNILKQKLTVLSVQFPELFNKAIFCGWFGAIISHKQPANVCDSASAFVAGLMHDIGMLHLNPDFIESTRELSSEEWRQLQSHPIISEQILLNTNGIDKTISDAVADHHESIDATGYPAGKISQQINKLAQLLNLLDTCYAAYDKHFRPKNRSLADLEPLIQVNPNYRNNKDAETLLLILRSAEKTTDCFTPAAHIDKLFDLVTRKQNYITQFMDEAWKLSETVGYRHQIKKVLGLQNILIHVLVTIRRSGVSETAYAEWLEGARKTQEPDSYREAEDVALMLTEIIYHLRRFKISLGLLMNDKKAEAYVEPITEVLSALDNIKTVEIDPALNQYFVAPM